MESSKEIFQLGRTREGKWLLLKSHFYWIPDAVITANKTTGAAGMQDGMPERSETSHRKESKSGSCDSQEGEQTCKISLLLLLHLTFFIFKKIFLSSSPESCCAAHWGLKIFSCLTRTLTLAAQTAPCTVPALVVWDCGNSPGKEVSWCNCLDWDISYHTRHERSGVVLCRTIC